MRYLILSIVLVVALLQLTGCRARKLQVVPVDNVHIEYRDRHTVDSITTIDTVRIAERGDTVLIDRVRYRDRVRVQLDTLMRIDTVTVVQTVEVPERLTAMEQFHSTLASIGGWLAWAAKMAALLILCYYGFKLYKRFM